MVTHLTLDKGGGVDGVGRLEAWDDSSEGLKRRIVGNGGFDAVAFGGDFLNGERDWP